MHARTFVAFTAAALIGAFVATPGFAQDAMAGSGQAMSHDAMHKTAMQGAMHSGCTPADKHSMHHGSMKQGSMKHDSMQGAKHANCMMQKDGMMKMHDATKTKKASSSAADNGG